MSLSRRLANLLRSNRHADDLDRELSFHLRERADDLVAGGMSREVAEREARKRFGNYASQKENARDADIFVWLDTLVDDVRYAARTLRNAPGFTLVAILSLALGIGANTAIFSLINAVVLRSLPVKHPEQLVQIVMADSNPTFTNPLWEQIRDHQTVFDGMLAYAAKEYNMAPAGETRPAAVHLVSGDYFRTLGVQPVVGRTLTAADDQRGCPSIGVLSYSFWQTEFAGESNVLGKTVMLNAFPMQIVGVAQEGFAGLDVGRAAQIFVPICAATVLRGPFASLDNRSVWWLTIMARGKPGDSIEHMHAGLSTIAKGVFEATVPQGWRQAQKDRYARNGLVVAPASTGLSNLRRTYGKALYILLGIVSLVLLIACANVANLLLARAAVRQRETAIRIAIGAARMRVVRQLLTESLLLSLSGAAIGLLFAQWGSRLMVRFLSASTNQIFLDLGVDHAVLAFTIGVALVTGVLFGVGPAWRAARVPPNAALKANGRGVVEGNARFRVGKFLVASQIAISLALVVAAGLLIGTFRNVSTLDAGFKPADVLLVSVQHTGAPPSSSDAMAKTDAILARLRAIPGVLSASMSTVTPLGNTSWNEEMLIDGFTPSDADDGVAYFNATASDYFRTLRTPIIAGRDFNSGDRIGTPPVALVNETMARKFYKTPNPVGKTFRYRVGARSSDPVEIIGVVKDAKYQTLREKTLPTAFVAIAQDSDRFGVNFELRIPSGASAAAEIVRSAITDVDPRMSTTMTSFESQVASSLTRERLLATLSGFFGGLAILLSMIGLYGVLSYNTARRRSEIGVRMALGAGQRRIALMVLSEVGGVIAAGFLVGIGLSFLSTKLIASFLFGLEATDAMTLVASMAALALVAMIAAYLPARRASRVDPIEALREE
jgi:putative ABC transport system permease protein